MTVSLALNALVAVLLMAVIVLGTVLARRLAAVRAAQSEFATLGATFAEATAKAETGLAVLRKTAEAEGAALQERIQNIESLKDDLVFLVDRANESANRLEHAILEGRAAERSRSSHQSGARLAKETPRLRPHDPDQTSDDDPYGDDPGSLQAAGRELLHALQAMR